MPLTRTQSVALAFVGIDATESARQQVQYTPPSGTARVLDAAVIEVVHAERTAGAGTVVFTIRGYSAASGGKLRFSEALSLAVAGTPAAQAIAAGLRRYFDAGVWVTVQAAAGAGHDVEVQIQAAPAAGG